MFEYDMIVAYSVLPATILVSSLMMKMTLEKFGVWMVQKRRVLEGVEDRWLEKERKRPMVQERSILQYT